MAEHFGYKRKYDGALVLDDINAPPMGTIKLTSITTAGAVTLTVDQIMSGLILRDCAGAVRTDTLPTAALFAGEGFLVNTGIRFSVRNVSDDAAEVLTLAVGTGITAHASTDLTIEPGQSNEYLLLITNVSSGSEAATLYQVSGNNNVPTPGTVTQTGNIVDPVTLNTKVGAVTTIANPNIAGDASNVFTVNNALVTSSSVVLANVIDFTTFDTNGSPSISIEDITNGAFDIRIHNMDPATAINAAVTIGFVVYP